MPTIQSPTLVYVGNVASYYGWPNPSPRYTFGAYGGYTNIGIENRRTWVTNPNYRQKILLRQDATNPYQVSALTGKFGFVRGLLDSKNKTVNAPMNSSSLTKNISVPSIAFGTSDASLRSLAIERLRRRLKRSIDQTSSMVTILEMKDMKRLIPSLVDLTTTVVKELVDIRKTRGRSALRYASKAWLTYGFGVRPLLSDVDAHMKAMASFLARQDHRVRVTSTARKDWFTSHRPYSTDGSGLTANRLAPMHINVQMHHELSYRFIASFDLKIASSNNYDIGDHLGLKFPHVLPSLWEATAYSWIADYFTNIGEYLDAYFVAPPGNTVYIVENRRYRIKFNGQLWLNKQVGDPVIFLDHQRALLDLSYYEFERLSHPSLPRPGLRFRSLDEVGLFGVNKLLNLVSLLTSRL